MKKNGSTGSPHRRSVGVTIVAGMNLLIGIFLLKNFISFLMNTIKESSQHGESLGFWFMMFFAVGVLIFSLCFIRLGFLTYKLIPKARLYNEQVAKLGIVFCALFVALGFIIVRQKFSLEQHIFWIGWTIYFIWLLIFFTRPKVKEQFK